MNKERLLELADAIENQELSDLKFDMSTWRDERPCGTAACIAGHAAALYTPEEFYNNSSLDIRWLAAEALGLDDNQMRRLFTPNHAFDYDLESIDRAWAVRALRHAAATGKIDRETWEATRNA